MHRRNAMAITRQRSRPIRLQNSRMVSFSKQNHEKTQTTKIEC